VRRPVSLFALCNGLETIILNQRGPLHSGGDHCARHPFESRDHENKTRSMLPHYSITMKSDKYREAEGVVTTVQYHQCSSTSTSGTLSSSGIFGLGGVHAPRLYTGFAPYLHTTSSLASHHASHLPRVLGSQSRTRAAQQPTEITKSSPMPSATSTALATSGKRRINPTRNPRSPTLFSICSTLPKLTFKRDAASLG